MKKLIISLALLSMLSACAIGSKCTYTQEGTVREYDKSIKQILGKEIIENVDADVLIETTASNYKDEEPGMSHIISAMKRKMHVISVNKGPLALAFPSLMELATYNQVMLRFSGCV
jgi:homoserine dehydrogenase